MTTSEPNQASIALISTVIAHLPAIALPDPENTPSRFEATALVAQIDGTSRLAENLAKAGREGAEQFSATLNSFLGRLITEISEAGGQIARIEGDELTGFFPRMENETAEACQSRAERVAARLFELPVGTLGVRLGLAYGPVNLLRFGSAGMGRELVLAGPALMEARTNSQLDQIQTAKVVMDLDLSLTEEITFQQEEEGLILSRLINWLPPAVWQRLKDDPDFSGDWQRAVVLNLQFEGPDYTDPAGLKHLQKYYNLVQNICSRQSGLLYRFQPGEAGNPHRMALVFGTLLSHSDDAERALRTGLALRRLPDYLDFIRNQSIGVASSTAFAGPLGNAQRRQFVVTGEALPGAARAAEHAGQKPELKQQGGLLVDRYTYERVALNFLFGEELLVEQPGRKFPMKAAPLLAERKFISALKRYWKDATPVIGHAAELAQLEELASAAMGDETRAFLLTGPEGIGKSALLGEASARWINRAGTGAVGVCYQHGDGRPYLGWAGVLAWLCDFVDADTRMARVGKINSVISRYTPDYPELVAPVQQILNVTPYSRSLFARLVQPGEERDHLFELFANLIEGRSAEQPLMIELENLQWNDPASHELLTYLIERIKTSAVLFGLTSLETVENLPEDVVRLEIEPLGDEESLELAEHTALAGKEPLSVTELTHITALAEGNPLQIIQSVKYWQREGHLPDSLEDVTLSRLAFSERQK